MLHAYATHRSDKNHVRNRVSSIRFQPLTPGGFSRQYNPVEVAMLTHHLVCAHKAQSTDFFSILRTYRCALQGYHSSCLVTRSTSMVPSQRNLLAKANIGFILLLAQLSCSLLTVAAQEQGPPAGEYTSFLRMWD